MPNVPVAESPVPAVRRIIERTVLVAAALLLAGCSMLRLAYDQAPQFVYWWVDGYVDVDDSQSPRLREAIDGWFAWHRRDQLPAYAALLARAQREIVSPVTPAAMCGWTSEVQRRVAVAFDEAVPQAAELMLTSTPAQLRHLERRLKRSLDEMRDDFAQPDPVERRAEMLERAVKRSENLYGRLDAAQRDWLAAELGRSIFDAERWLAERRLRHQDLLRTLTTVTTAARTSTDRAAVLGQARAAARTLAGEAQRSPRPEYRAYQQRLLQENCAVAAGLHNLTTPAQREHARAKLKGWEDDVRALVAAGESGRSRAERPLPGIESR